MSARIEDSAFETTADLFGMLAAPTRLRILCALLEGERSVSELLAHVAVSQPNMSQHLGMLYRGRLLARRRTGARILYRISNEQVHRLCLAIKHQQGTPLTEMIAAGAGR